MRMPMYVCVSTCPCACMCVCDCACWYTYRSMRMRVSDDNFIRDCKSVCEQEWPLFWISELANV